MIISYSFFFFNFLRKYKMPLIVVCGYPSSGKTEISNKIKHFIETEKQKTVKIVSENKIVEATKNKVFASMISNNFLGSVLFSLTVSSQ